MSKGSRKETLPKPSPEGAIAKRAHVVHQNKYHFDIKEGDDVSDEKKFPGLLKVFEAVLKLEKVI